MIQHRTTRGRKSSRPPETAVPVLKLYYQRATKIQPTAGDGRFSTSWLKATTVSVLKLYYQRTKIQPPAGDGRSSTKVATRERKSRRPPATAVPVLKLYCRRTKIQPAAGDGRFSIGLVLPEDENPAARRRRPFQYSSCTIRERKSSQLPATVVLLEL